MLTRGETRYSHLCGSDSAAQRGAIMVFALHPSWVFPITAIYHYVQRQSILAGVGLVALFVLMRIDYHVFRPNPPGLILSFALLVLVCLWGGGQERPAGFVWGLAYSRRLQVCD